MSPMATRNHHLARFAHVFHAAGRTLRNVAMLAAPAVLAIAIAALFVHGWSLP